MVSGASNANKSFFGRISEKQCVNKSRRTADRINRALNFSRRNSARKAAEIKKRGIDARTVRLAGVHNASFDTGRGNAFLRKKFVDRS